jgi:hypothetical protein
MILLIATQFTLLILLFQFKTDYENALVAAYDPLQSSYVNVMLGEIASDNT